MVGRIVKSNDRYIKSKYSISKDKAYASSKVPTMCIF